MNKQELESFATIVSGIDVPDDVLSVSVDSKEIHLLDKDFFSIFDDYNVGDEFGLYRYRASATIAGATVFCLTNRDMERWGDYV